jgi:hypothetical protein
MNAIGEAVHYLLTLLRQIKSRRKSLRNAQKKACRITPAGFDKSIGPKIHHR